VSSINVGNSILFKKGDAESQWIVNLVSFEEFLGIGLAAELAFMMGRGVDLILDSLYSTYTQPSEKSSL
jgi:hypothetical protein